MGSSTGELLVDHPEILREVYCKMHSNHPGVPISLHCENDQVIAQAAKAYEGIKPSRAAALPWHNEAIHTAVAEMLAERQSNRKQKTDKQGKRPAVIVRKQVSWEDTDF
jgi:dihydroorotase-like cyclic amidohydrolase